MDIPKIGDTVSFREGGYKFEGQVLLINPEEALVLIRMNEEEPDVGYHPSQATPQEE